MCQDLNIVKTQLGTNPRGWAKTHGVAIEITHVIFGPNEAQVLDSHHRKNSVTDKVMSNKWIYLERNTLCL